MDTRLPDEFTADKAPLIEIPVRHGCTVKRGASDPKQVIPPAADRARYELPETLIDDAISLVAFLAIFFGGMFVAWGFA